MGRSSSVSDQDQIKTLLQRLKRQTNDGGSLPSPDEASAALGRHLGTAFVALTDEKVVSEIGDQIANEMASTNVNPSVPHAYFEIISSGTSALHTNVLLECLPRWICHCDQIMQVQQSGACSETLSAAIRAYVEICHRHVVEEEAVEERLLDTYFRLQLPTSRTCLVRNFTRRLNFGAVRLFLSPLMAACVLTKSSAFEEKSLFLQGLWRECWIVLRSPKISLSGDIFDLLSWMQTSLHLFVLGIAGEPMEREVVSMEIAHEWLVQLTDAICHIVQNTSEDKEESLDSLSTIVETVMRDIVPHFYTTSCCRIPMDVILYQLLAAINDQKGMHAPSESVALFRLSTLALSTPIREDISGITSLLATCLKRNNYGVINGMMHALTCVYGYDETLKGPVTQLRQAATLPIEEEDEFEGRATNVLHVLTKHPDEEDKILRVITESMESGTLRLSVTQQNAALLLGIALLQKKSAADQGALIVEDYLKQLIQQFPHLGITLLPVVVESTQASSRQQDGRAVLHWLEFLCDAVVHDPHCAQEVWNIVGVKLVEGDTTVLRSCVIRLYPRLCRSNKKLYRRVIDALGASAMSKEPEVRLAVVATIADLAKEDRIRDVSDVIGWIQSFLADENTSIVNIAVMSLHHLVVAQELDFDVVIKVLNKRLCAVTNLQEVLKLKDVCLEALVLLLGDGECEHDESSDDEQRTGETMVVSPQVTGAVQVLIELLLSPALSPTANETIYSVEAISRIRQNIYKSLSNYSLPALGIDEDIVRAAAANGESDAGSEIWMEAGSRYHALTNVVVDGLRSPMKPQDIQDPSDCSDPQVVIARKLIGYEEVVLGPSLWQKGGKTASASKSDARKTRAQKAAIAALPSPDIVHRLHNEYPSTASALSSLLCFQFEFDGKQPVEFGGALAQLSDIANDISNDSTDPMILALGVQGWLHSVSRLWNVIEQSDDDSYRRDSARTIKAGIQGWRDTFEQGDHSYLALASFSIFVPDPFTDILDEIYNELMDAYGGHFFENHDIAHICLGLVGVRAVRSREWPRMTSVVELLEKATNAHGGQGGFGAYYGLGLVAQVLPEAKQSKGASSYDERAPASSQIGQIVGILVGELLSCMQSANPALISLVACLKSGKTSPDLVPSMSCIKESSLLIHDSMRQKVESLCLSLALCLPALEAVSSDLLLASYHLLDGLPWGCGKGLAMPSTVLACLASNLMQQQDVDNVVQRFSQTLELAVKCNDVAATGDSFYALCLLCQLNTSTEELVSLTIHRFLGPGGSPDFFRGSRSLYAIAAVALTLGSAPCLGSGVHSFHQSLQLHPMTTHDRVATVVDMLLNIASNSDDSRSREAATLVLGLLSSMKLESNDKKGPHLSVGSTGNAKSFTTAVTLSTQTSSMMFSKMPQGQPGTMLSEVLFLTQQYFGIDVTVSSEMEVQPASQIPKLLGCLKTVSIPGQFVTTFLEPVLDGAGLGSDAVKAAAVQLLISQSVGRRRAAFDGREFMNMVARISLLPKESFTSLLGDTGAQVFLSSLPRVLPKFPSPESVTAAVENAWQFCTCSDDFSLTVAAKLLSPFQALLRNASSTAEKGKVQMSPKMISTIRKFVVQTAFTGICDLDVVAGDKAQSDNLGVLLEAYSDCLREIPLTVLDEMEFTKHSSSQTKASILSVICTMMLVRHHYFEESGRTSREVTKAVTWLLREQVSPADRFRANAFRRVAIEIAFAAKSEARGSRKDILLMILEALVLVKGPRRIWCLEFLAMMLASWVQEGGSSAEFSLSCLFVGQQQCRNKFFNLSASAMQSISEMLVYDLPWNLGTYCRAERASAMVVNRVWSIYKVWSDDGEDQYEVECLRKTMACCRGTDASEQEYASVATTMLL